LASDNPFDPVNLAKSVPPAILRPKKDRKPYVCGPIPVPWFQACPPHAALTGLSLWFVAGMSHRQTALTVACRKLFGLSQRKLHRDLLALEAAGLITRQTSPGRLPVVDLLERQENLEHIDPDGTRYVVEPTGRPQYILGPLPVAWFAKAGATVTHTGLALWRAHHMARRSRRQAVTIRPALRHLFDQDRQKQRRDIAALAAAGLVTIRRDNVVTLPRC